MCAGIVIDRLVGPYLLLHRLKAAQCLEKLDVEVSVGERIRMWYLHNGAPPLYARPVTEWLIIIFPTSGSVETAAFI